MRFIFYFIFRNLKFEKFRNIALYILFYISKFEEFRNIALYILFYILKFVIWKISKYCAKMIFIRSLIFLFLIKIRFPKGISISEILTNRTSCLYFYFHFL